jgi:DNA helicase-2/ATP-dependent DNA helicase PcrA
MPKKEYSIGDQVEHKLFGKGTILEIEKVGDNTNLTIEFSGKISKKIISTYVKLVKE